MLKRDAHAADAISEASSLMTEDVFDSRLKTHKLKGGLSNCWASSAGYDLRIVFEFVQHEEVEAILLLSMGTHDEVY
jgi:mRNA-degrading endonuclease YafQ of YafQ-DinJ toxin-antitoxin module